MTKYRCSLKILVFLMLTGLYLSGPVSAGFQEGMAAYKRAEYKVAFQEFKAASELGHPEAQFYLSVCFVRGWGVTRDISEGERWIRKSAEQGNANGQVGLAMLYYNEKNYDEAMNLYRKAAEQGHEVGQYYLASMLAKAEGVPKDYTEAFEWLSKAAEQGGSSSQYALAYMYAKGQGVPINSLMSYKWTILAVINGSKGAKNLLSTMIIFIIVSIIFQVFILRFATKLSVDFKPSF